MSFIEGMGAHNLSPAARNADLQQRERARRNLPGVAEAEADAQARRENGLLADLLGNALDIVRSRLRAAANHQDRGMALAEKIICEIEQKCRDLRPQAGISIEEQTRRLHLQKTYLEEIDVKLPELIASVNEEAAAQLKEKNLVAATQRRIAWGREAERLKAHGCVQEIEKDGRRLQLRDGVLGVVGGRIDDRHRVFISTWRDEIERAVRDREEWHPIENE